MRPGAALLLMAWLALGPPAAECSTRQPILVAMQKVVDELAASGPGGRIRPGRRLSVANGLLGLGPHQPAGGTDFGLEAPPLSLFPRAGLGNSLNLDPNTGRPY